MSNSIWKKPDQKPERFRTVIFQSIELEEPELGHWDGQTICPHNEFESLDMSQITRWCYLDCLITQADKAERLQKAVDNSREKLAAFMHDVWGNWFAYQLNNSTVENLQRWGIQSNTPYSSLTETDKDKDRKFADQIIEIIKDEIKQLIRETTNDK